MLNLRFPATNGLNKPNRVCWTPHQLIGIIADGNEVDIDGSKIHLLITVSNLSSRRRHEA